MFLKKDAYMGLEGKKHVLLWNSMTQYDHTFLYDQRNLICD